MTREAAELSFLWTITSAIKNFHEFEVFLKSTARRTETLLTEILFWEQGTQSGWIPKWHKTSKHKIEKSLRKHKFKSSLSKHKKILSEKNNCS